jgi:hypothetical protein
MLLVTVADFLKRIYEIVSRRNSRTAKILNHRSTPRVVNTIDEDNGLVSSKAFLTKGMLLQGVELSTLSETDLVVGVNELRLSLMGLTFCADNFKVSVSHDEKGEKNIVLIDVTSTLDVSLSGLQRLGLVPGNIFKDSENVKGWHSKVNAVFSITLSICNKEKTVMLIDEVVKVESIECVTETGEPLEEKITQLATPVIKSLCESKDLDNGLHYLTLVLEKRNDRRECRTKCDLSQG